MRRVLAALVLTAAVAAVSGSAAPPAARIVFAAVASNLQYPTEPPTARYTAELVSIRPDGALRRRLTQTVAWEDDPTWSPDRRRLAFIRGTPVCHAATCDGSNDTSVWTAFASGAPKRRLTRPPDGYADAAPAWSPDGRSVAFIRHFPTDNGSEDGVYVVDRRRPRPAEAHGGPSADGADRLVAGRHHDRGRSRPRRRPHGSGRPGERRGRPAVRRRGGLVARRADSSPSPTGPASTSSAPPAAARGASQRRASPAASRGHPTGAGSCSRGGARRCASVPAIGLTRRRISTSSASTAAASGA